LLLLAAATETGLLTQLEQALPPAADPAVAPVPATLYIRSKNQEGNSHTGNLDATYLMRTVLRKRTGRAIISALFWNGYIK
jgi:hypothetical protein